MRNATNSDGVITLEKLSKEEKARRKELRFAALKDAQRMEAAMSPLDHLREKAKNPEYPDALIGRMYRELLREKMV